MIGGRGEWRKGRSSLCCVPVLAALAVACGDECTAPPIFLHALRIEVFDAASGETICGAEVTIESAGKSERLPGACVYSGGDGSGPYRVTVARDGYQTKVVSNVEIADAECPGSSTKELTLRLQPASA